MKNLSKSCAIVGAGEGLGAALAARFARGGYDIGLVSRSEAGSAAAFAAARSARDETRVLFRPGDADRPETIEQALATLGQEMGNFELLIYNVRGAFTGCSPLEMTADALEAAFRVEVVGAFSAAKAVLSAMRAHNRGTIFFSSATAAFRGSASHPLYSISKFGLRSLSQSLSKAYAADGVHIVHVRLDCDLDVPIMRRLYGEAYRPGKLAKPEDVAETYWLIHRQPKGAWSNEVEVRPCTETWTC